MIIFIIPIILVILSFCLRGWKGLIFQIILLGINSIVPDGIPFVDEILMGVAIFNNLRGIIKAIKIARAAKKVGDGVKNIKDKAAKSLRGRKKTQNKEIPPF